MDATVVSLIPMSLNEVKPGLFPGEFAIPAAKPGDFEILQVGVSHYSVYMDSSRGSLRVPELGDKIAKAIVDDYVSAQIGISDNCRPGLFFVPGKHTKEEIAKNFTSEIDKAREWQLNWFRSLVMMGDDNWKRFGTHSSIAGVQRVAAKALNYKAEWVV